MGYALAGSSTLIRFELAPENGNSLYRYKKSVGDFSGIEELTEAKSMHEEEGKPCRIFRGFYYRTQNSWSRYRRVIGKAEHLEKGSNPRFVVTSLVMSEYTPLRVYDNIPHPKERS